GFIALLYIGRWRGSHHAVAIGKRLWRRRNVIRPENVILDTDKDTGCAASENINAAAEEIIPEWRAGRLRFIVRRRIRIRQIQPGAPLVIRRLRFPGSKIWCGLFGAG